jgi:hypothetical protein
MSRQNPKLPIDLMVQIHNIPIFNKNSTKINEINNSMINPRSLTHNLSDTIAVDMIAPLMTSSMTQQQRYVMSQIMKYPNQIDEIIKAAMAAGVKPPIFKGL